MNSIDNGMTDRIPAIIVHQWLKEWDNVDFNDKERRRRPEPYYYMFTLSAAKLRALANVSRRTTKNGLPRSQDIGIQRSLDRTRADEIRQYVQFGYPWSELNQRKRESKKFDDLKKPGWLPTAIVVNILVDGDERRTLKVEEDDYINVEKSSKQGLAEILLPKSFNGPDWMPKQLPPIEVIDGQHRLFAFDDNQLDEDYELPVVAFRGLDISWQAYLFWTINIKPKKINPSLAFDMYPLLRTEDWLERFEGHSVYRETRAQELTEAIWANPNSPWYQRINMLGETGQKGVSQAAWIRSLMATYVKSSSNPLNGGLFGAPIGNSNEALSWTRAQQAAFLIKIWLELRDAIKSCDYAWAKNLRELGGADVDDLAFAGPFTLLNTDQGVRSVLAVTNDLFYFKADELKLAQWISTGNTSASDISTVDNELDSLNNKPFIKFLHEIVSALASYDWRLSSAFKDANDEERIRKLALRGSSGYRELRRQLLNLLAESDTEVGSISNVLLMIQEKNNHDTK